VMLRGLCSVFLLCSGYCLGQSVPAAAPALETGKVLEHVVCAKFPEQSYALYLPSTYSAKRDWPVVFAFDPGARGKVPVELMKEAAERYGFIVLGSNNSRNGTWKPEADAADAMLQDAQERFSVDLKRIYFAGFSGGARVASQLAQLCKCSAGVLLSGAGFSQNSLPQRDTFFPVFSAVGNLDFNFSEVVPLQDKLEQIGYPHWLRAFDGVHEWAPASVMEEAFGWFRIQAMRTNREPRDEKFISAELKTAADGAEKYSANGDSLSAWRQYKEIAETYDGLADVTTFRAKAEELSRAKSVQDALKRERNDFADQERLSSQILGALQTKENPEAPPSEGPANVLQDVRDLRQRSESEKKPERDLVLKRALAGIFVGAIETGNDTLDKKDYRSAVRYFSAAAEVKPDSEWPLRRLAVALALDKNRKAALETLKRAKTKASDAAEFIRWVQSEPAFQDLRNRPEFGELGI
jgi:predicted esterase